MERSKSGNFNRATAINIHVITPLHTARLFQFEIGAPAVAKGRARVFFLGQVTVRLSSPVAKRGRECAHTRRACAVYHGKKRQRSFNELSMNGESTTFIRSWLARSRFRRLFSPSVATKRATRSAPTSTSRPRRSMMRKFAHLNTTRWIRIRSCVGLRGESFTAISLSLSFSLGDKYPLAALSISPEPRMTDDPARLPGTNVFCAISVARYLSRVCIIVVYYLPLGTFNLRHFLPRHTMPPAAAGISRRDE